MTQETMDVSHDTGEGLPAGARHYRAYVGPPEKYDRVASMQFNLLTALGLREAHSLLDIGCGSLRAGKLFIPYLLPGLYYGVEPNKWLVNEGIAREIGHDLVRIKQPQFSFNGEFDFSGFNQNFDFILAQSIFSHTSQGQMLQCLKNAAAVMHPRSIFAATYLAGTTDYKGQDWAYPESIRFRWRTIREQAFKAGLEAHHVVWPHPTGQTWVVFAPYGSDFDASLISERGSQYLLTELDECREQLRRLRNHPYVRAGLWLYERLAP